MVTSTFNEQELLAQVRKLESENKRLHKELRGSNAENSILVSKVEELESKVRDLKDVVKEAAK